MKVLSIRMKHKNQNLKRLNNLWIQLIHLEEEKRQ